MNINHDQRLYVIPEGSGYSCMGFDVCETKIRALVADLGPDAANVAGTLASPGTDAHYRAYTRLCEIARNRFDRTGVKSTVGLTPQLRGLEGSRVEVIDAHGETRRFIVGKSMGWIPCHIERKRRDSTGGGAVFGAPFRSVRVISTYK